MIDSLENTNQGFSYIDNLWCPLPWPTKLAWTIVMIVFFVVCYLNARREK